MPHRVGHQFSGDQRGIIEHATDALAPVKRVAYRPGRTRVTGQVEAEELSDGRRHLITGVPDTVPGQPPVPCGGEACRRRGGQVSLEAAGQSSVRLSFCTRPSKFGYTPAPWTWWIAGRHISHRWISVRPTSNLIKSRSNAPWLSS